MAVAGVGVGLRAQKGGAVVVGVVLDDDQPRIVLSSFLSTGADRLSLEPYRVARDLPLAEAAAAVAEGRGRQEQLAGAGLRMTIERLGRKPALAALLVNRAGWVTDLLSYSLAFAEHAAVADNLAVREALRSACRQAAIEVVDCDEKSLPDVAAQVLDLSPAEIAARLKGLGAHKPWRKEQKLACLAAWLALAAPPAQGQSSP